MQFRFLTGPEGDASDADCWFAQVRFVFSTKDNKGRTRSCIFVRWYDLARHDRTDEHLSGSIRKLKWETTCMHRNGRTVQLPMYDVVEIDRVIKPAFIQPHPLQPDNFFYNRFV